MSGYGTRTPYTHSRASVDSAPLLAYLGDGSSRQLGARCGVSQRTVVRWRRGGGMPMRVAETVCDALGVYPTDVWGEEWWHYIECVCEDTCWRCRRRDGEAAYSFYPTR